MENYSRVVRSDVVAVVDVVAAAVDANAFVVGSFAVAVD